MWGRFIIWGGGVRVEKDFVYGLLDGVFGCLWAGWRIAMGRLLYYLYDLGAGIVFCVYVAYAAQSPPAKPAQHSVMLTLCARIV